MKRLLAIATAAALLTIGGTQVGFAQGKGRGGAQKSQGKQTGPRDGAGQQQGKQKSDGPKGKQTGPKDGSGPIHTPRQPPVKQ